MNPENLLLLADSDHDANMLYAVGMFVPDPFIFLRLGGKNYVILNDLEIDRARREVKNCEVISLSSCQVKYRKKRGKLPNYGEVIAAFLKEHKEKRVHVPHNFPLGWARALKDKGIKIKVKKGGFFPERELKAPEEVKKLSAALMMAEVGLAEGIQALKSSKSNKRGQLVYRNSVLTSERLRAVIDTAIIQAGGVANRTIVAGGLQACDPHEVGHGPLKANQLIILDVFPRSQKTGYFGDITRTVVKGKASEAARKLYHTVARGQEIAFKEIAHGIKGAEVHGKVTAYFEAQGYKTGKQGGRMQGFFHGTGHGLGLEIHESPRISPTSQDTLQAGHVLTVEPGLYYPSIGGVRLEDVAYITPSGPRNLTKFEKVLEI
ncbi:MAG: Xaa-Pro peptidase family protein [Verrucomicrobiota bacterium]|nr:Xaa-Pro peptidase family protein [Verrucomicrobiota bacterium]